MSKDGKFSLPNCVGRSFDGRNFYLHQKKDVKQIYLIAEEEAIPRCFHPIVPPSPAICLKIFGHLPPFAPVYGQPLDPTSTLIDKNVITGYCCNNIYGKKAISGCFYPIFPPSPTSCLKIQFLTIYPHLRLFMGNPLTLPPLLLTKMLSLDAVAIIHTERK